MLNSFLFRTLSAYCDGYSVIILDGHKQEARLGGGATRHCFNDLTANTQYKISVYAQLQDTEGPAVTTTERTCRCPHQLLLSIHSTTALQPSCYYSQEGFLQCCDDISSNITSTV
jgi:hypothetical protein